MIADILIVFCSFESIQHLFQQVNLPNTATAHWSTTSGWDMADTLAMEIIADLRIRVHASPFLTVTIDETSTNDLSEYLSVELQFIEGGTRVYEFLKLQKIDNQTAAAILEEVIAQLCVRFWTFKRLTRTGG